MSKLSHTPHWRDIADPMCCGQSDTLPLCSNCPLRDNRSPATNYEGVSKTFQEQLERDHTLTSVVQRITEWRDLCQHLQIQVDSAASETLRSEALKLAEEWKGRGDDAGRLSRAVIDSATSATPCIEASPLDEVMKRIIKCKDMREVNAIWDQYRREHGTA